MIRRPIAVLLLSACLAGSACQRAPSPADAGDAAAVPEPSTPRPANDTAAGQRIEADVRALADDAMEGREAGTPGYDKAAEYVAKRFADIGLAPAGDDDSFFQRVPLLKATLRAEGARFEVKRGGKTIALKFKDEFLPGSNYNAAEAFVEAPAVFVGQGVHAPELGHDDY